MDCYTSSVSNHLKNRIKRFHLVLQAVQKQSGDWKSLLKHSTDCQIRIGDIEYFSLADGHLYLIDQLRDSNRAHNETKKETIKIYFSGRVDSGKSTTINALLGRRLFVMANQARTGCTLRLVMSDQLKIEYEKGSNRNVENFLDTDEISRRIDMLSALDSKECLKITDTIRVFWNVPIEDNFVLKKGVELVDTPGINRQTNISEMLQNQYGDANIIVYLLTDGLNEEDRQFIRIQRQRTSPPDILLLVNMCTNDDGCSKDGVNTEQIHNEYQTFLMKDAGMKEDKARRRIFFVSSKEEIERKTENLEEYKMSDAQLERKKEFFRFEETLSQSIETAIRKRNQAVDSELKLLDSDLTESIALFHSSYREIKGYQVPHLCNVTITMMQQKRESLLNDLRKGTEEIIQNLLSTNKFFIFKQKQKELKTDSAEVEGKSNLPVAVDNNDVCETVVQFLAKSYYEDNESAEDEMMRHMAGMTERLCDSMAEFINVVCNQGQCVFKKKFEIQMKTPTMEHPTRKERVLRVLESISIKKTIFTAGTTLLSRLFLDIIPETSGLSGSVRDFLKKAILVGATCLQAVPVIAGPIRFYFQRQREIRALIAQTENAFQQTAANCNNVFDEVKRLFEDKRRILDKFDNETVFDPPSD